MTQPRAVSDASMLVTACALLVAPFAAIAVKLAWPQAALLFLVFFPYVWVIGYAAVVAAAVSMLRQRGALRSPWARPHARRWAWATSVGVVVFAATMVDGGHFMTDTGPNWNSVVVMLLGGAPRGSWDATPALVASNAVALLAAIAWIAGIVALVVTAVRSTRRARPMRQPLERVQVPR